MLTAPLRAWATWSWFPNCPSRESKVSGESPVLTETRYCRNVHQNYHSHDVGREYTDNQLQLKAERWEPRLWCSKAITESWAISKSITMALSRACRPHFEADIFYAVVFSTLPCTVMPCPDGSHVHRPASTALTMGCESTSGWCLVLQVCSTQRHWPERSKV